MSAFGEGSSANLPFPEDFLCLSEFSELEGPVPLLCIPADPQVVPSLLNLEDFVVRIQAADWQGRTADIDVVGDSQVILSDRASGVYALVHHFVLNDVHARGYIRPFCLTYLSNARDKIYDHFVDLCVHLTNATNVLKEGNRLQLLLDLERRVLDLAHTIDVLERDAAADQAPAAAAADAHHDHFNADDAAQRPALPAVREVLAETRLLRRKLHDVFSSDSDDLDPLATPKFGSPDDDAGWLLSGSPPAAAAAAAAAAAPPSPAVARVLASLAFSRASYVPSFVTTVLKGRSRTKLRDVGALCGDLALRAALTRLGELRAHFAASPAALAAGFWARCARAPVAAALHTGPLLLGNVGADGGWQRQFVADGAQALLDDADLGYLDVRVGGVRVLPGGGRAHHAGAHGEPQQDLQDPQDPQQDRQDPRDALAEDTSSSESEYEEALDAEAFLARARERPLSAPRAAAAHCLLDTSTAILGGAAAPPTFGARIWASSTAISGPFSASMAGTSLADVLRLPFARHLCFALLTGRPLLVAGTRDDAERCVRALEPLVVGAPARPGAPVVEPYRAAPIRGLRDLARLRLAGVAPEALPPDSVRAYAAVWELDRERLEAPAYHGALLGELCRRGATLAHVQVQLAELARHAFLYLHLCCLATKDTYDKREEHAHHGYHSSHSGHARGTCLKARKPSPRVARRAKAGRREAASSLAVAGIGYATPASGALSSSQDSYATPSGGGGGGGSSGGSGGKRGGGGGSARRARGDGGDGDGDGDGDGALLRGEAEMLPQAVRERERELYFRRLKMKPHDVMIVEAIAEFVKSQIIEDVSEGCGTTLKIDFMKNTVFHGKKMK